MHVVIGGADAIANLPYDSLYHKDNEFGDRIAATNCWFLKRKLF
jgi:methylmalonyl-CoA mutase